MGASQETFLWVKITQASYQITKWYVPKKKAPYMIYLKAYRYIVKLERNDIGIWGSGGMGAGQKTPDPKDTRLFLPG